MQLWQTLAVVAVGLSLSGLAFADGPQQARQFEAEITVKVQLQYLLYLPPGYETKPDEKWPLILFLHGAGESGSDLEKVKIHGPPKIVETKPMPFVIVSPQSAGRGWDMNALAALVDSVAGEHRVDKQRMYCTGLSMGGYGTWSLAAAHPKLFAAIAPICGGGNPILAERFKHLPTWAFHGAKDNVVPLVRSEEMVEALKKAGSDNVKLTVYPEADHDSWTETYNNPALYEWFLEHRRT